MKRLLFLMALLFFFPAMSKGQAQLAPVPCQQFFSSSGQPLANGKLYSYLAGTTTPTPTYTDNAQTTQNPNPILLNVAGYPVNATGACSVWLNPAISYKFVLQNSSSVQQWTVDGIIGGNLALIFGTANNWTALQTFNSGITGSGTIGLLGAGAGVLSAANNWTATQNFSAGISGTGSIGALTVPVANISPSATNGFCNVTVGGVATWTNCPSSSSQLTGWSTSTVTVNGNTASAQPFTPICNPCFSGGVLNVVGKTFDIEATGAATFSTTAITTNLTFVFDNNPSFAFLVGSSLPTTSTSQASWYYRMTCTTVNTGTSGTLQCFGFGFWQDANGVSTTMLPINRLAAGINLTNAHAIGAGITFSIPSTANVGYQLQGVIHQQN